MAPETGPLLDEARKLLDTLFGDAPEGLFVEVRRFGGDSAARQTFLPTGQPWQLESEWDGTTNVYYGVCLRKRRGGTAEDVSHAVALWVDDAKQPLPEDFPEPSIIVETSQGKFQQSWLLNEPTTDLERVEELNRRLIAMLKADNAGDRARVLRLPGFLNIKPEHPDKPRARIAHLDGATFTLDQLEALLPPKSARGRNGNGTHPTETIPEGQRNVTLTRLAGGMRRQGMTEDEIAASLLVVNQRRCVPSLPDDEVRGIAASVSRYPPAPAQADAPRKGDDDTAQFPRTDLGNAERLVRQHGDHICYVPAWGWLHYEGGRWRRVADQAIERLMQGVVRAIYAEAGAAPTREEADKIARHAIASEATGRIRAAVAAAQALCLADSGDFDRDPWLLNTPQGTVDLRSSTVKPHDPLDRITKVTRGNYRPGMQPGPVFHQVLLRAMSNALVMVEWLQRCFGYATSGSVREEMLFMHHGGGSNGKSTVLMAVANVLGEYATYLDPATLEYDPKRGGQRFDLAPLAGIRMAVTIEARGGSRSLDEGTVKRLVSREPIVGEFKHRDQFRFTPTHKIFWCFNEEPTVHGTDRGIWRRISKTPWLVTIPDNEQDKMLDEKLGTQDEMDGILSWCVDGARKYLEIGLAPPKAVQESTSAYRLQEDTLARWIEDCCIVGAGYEATVNALRTSYLQWSGLNGEEPMGAKVMGRQLKNKGFDYGKDKNPRTRTGIGLKA